MMLASNAEREQFRSFPAANLQKVLQSYCILPLKVHKGRAKMRNYIIFAQPKE